MNKEFKDVNCGEKGIQGCKYKIPYPKPKNLTR
jgi:hypothetical protein